MILRNPRTAAAVVEGFAIHGMHSHGMAASMREPGSIYWGGAAFDNNGWR